MNPRPMDYDSTALPLSYSATTTPHRPAGRQAPAPPRAPAPSSCCGLIQRQRRRARSSRRRAAGCRHRRRRPGPAPPRPAARRRPTRAPPPRAGSSARRRPPARCARCLTSSSIRLRGSGASPSQLTSDSSATAQPSALFGADHHPAGARARADDVEPLAGRDREPAPLADREARSRPSCRPSTRPSTWTISPGSAASGRSRSTRPRVVALRHEADVLAVGLVGDRQAEARGAARGSRPWRGRPAESAGTSSCSRRRGEQEIALVARGIGGAVQLGAVRADLAADIVAGRQRGRAEIAGDAAAGP